MMLTEQAVIFAWSEDFALRLHTTTLRAVVRGMLLQQLAAKRKVTSFYRDDEQHTSVHKIAADSKKGENRRCLFFTR
ncbi:hypothetical protein HPB47_013365 [Ixodes persulcatus]|uniref:Uncharacterized protein n=1 Tax=Ixodes persulcatus TaxID=34615 RepID=A0AC60R011_IXOPE|nr:hypothetical protein HPB47_013365 [Ixodes persulcatus]